MKKPKAPSAADRINALTHGRSGGSSSKALVVPESKNPKITPVEIVKVDRRHFNKRTPGTGRKTLEATLIARGLKQMIDDHSNEMIDVEITVDVTVKGVTKKIKKMVKVSRFRHALEKLFRIGTEGTGDADAINKWLDRVAGKPAQPVVGDEDAPPVQVEIGSLLAKIYGD